MDEQAEVKANGAESVNKEDHDTTGNGDIEKEKIITYIPYRDEDDMFTIKELMDDDLSEPYSIHTYQYFIHGWPELSFLAMDGDKPIGAIVCKLDEHKHPRFRMSVMRGYIAMLAVQKEYRRKGIAVKLVKLALEKMREMGADECGLETEICNQPALSLYLRSGFIKRKYLSKYYLNGNDAYRLSYAFLKPNKPIYLA